MALTANQRSASKYQLSLLGNFQLTLGGKSIHLPTRKVELLFAYLVLHPEPHPREKLAALLWGDSPDEQARGSLRKALTLIRKVFGADIFLSSRETVQLNPAYPIWVDVFAFQDRADHILLTSSDNEPSIENDLYQGDLLAAYYEDWIEPLRDKLRDLHLRTLFHLVNLYKIRSQFGNVILLANRILAFEPSSEDAYQHLMLAYWSNGDRVAALRQFEACQRALRNELGVEPSAETLALYQHIQQAPASQPSATRRTNLPLELTSFIGRQREISKVQVLLKEQRLVTLTGSGGVGKTRLSIQVARRLLPELPDGVWYIELAPVSDPDLVVQTFAATLGLREEQNRPLLGTLCHFLAIRELLLVVDNCEHLLDTCARLADTILRHAPKIKILTTSREAMGIAGEYSFRVPSLAVPEPQQNLSLDAIQETEAVQLFLERAKAVSADFTIHFQNSEAVTTICQRLDGIPLALELAAARLNILTPEQIAQRLDNAFRLLTIGSRTALPRQQTLRAAIDWSYQLLSPEEQVILRRLAVFSGGGSLSAVEAICNGEGIHADQILDLLTGLVGKSMTIAMTEQGLEMRYHLLETVQQYAREKLVESGETAWLRSRHLVFYVGLCEEAFQHLHGAGRLKWVRLLKGEQSNIREALDWSFQDPIRALDGLQIATCITDRFWEALGLYREAARWLNTGLHKAGDNIPKLLGAKAYYSLMWVTSDAAQDKAVTEQCIALCREIGPEAYPIFCLALPYQDAEDYEEKIINVTEALNIARALGHGEEWQLAEVLFSAAKLYISHPQGAYDDQALAAAQESLRIANRNGDRWYAYGYLVIGFIHLLHDRGDQACQIFDTALTLFSEIEDHVGISLALFHLALYHRLAEHFVLAYDYGKQMVEYADAVGLEYYYTFFAYTTGMLIVNTLNDQFSRNHSLADQESAGQKAVRLLSFVKKSQIGYQIWVWYNRVYPIDSQAVKLLRDRLGEDIFSQAWSEGQALTLEEAITSSLTLHFESSNDPGPTFQNHTVSSGNRGDEWVYDPDENKR